MGAFDLTTIVRTNETLGIIEEDWIILRLVFEAFTNKDMKMWAALNPHFTKAVLHLSKRYGFTNISKAGDMLREERRQAQAKEQP